MSLTVLFFEGFILFFWQPPLIPTKGSSAGKESACTEGDPWFDSWVRKIPWRRDRLPLQYSWASLVGQLVKNPPAVQETWAGSLGSGRPPGGRAWQPLPEFLPGKSHGQRGLVSNSRWGVRESDTTEAAEHARTLLINSTAMNTPRYAIPRDFPGGSAVKKSACQC